ncbi:MAG: hypothetical protein B5766_01380 [Candidatus Lumbricidophila eiseniae]|uniref:Uncharacterized protein n=1 Tax=Candidatus Lumbricidiphila eiseniae TaxID=1969409 RepID=A0A2A6FTY7_9MICO|nr:MAG: hypothetical protein B5766_01380 [Candidatus Lumbricidophila eiseniae]
MATEYNPIRRAFHEETSRAYLILAISIVSAFFILAPPVAPLVVLIMFIVGIVFLFKAKTRTDRTILIISTAVTGLILALIVVSIIGWNLTEYQWGSFEN